MSEGMISTTGPRRRLLEPDGDNAIAVALGILGDEWNLWILRHAMQGARRYNDWIDRGQISNSVLTARLARLTELELFERVPYQHRPTRYEYRQTDLGRSVWPVLLAMWSWEQHWDAGAAALLPHMRHSVCGNVFTPTLLCDACREPADARDVVARIGPSGGWRRSVPAASNRRRSGDAARPPGVLPHTMELLGNRWSAALLGAAFLGATRYSEFAERMGAPPATVADRLRTFTALEVLRADPNPHRPDWVIYRLTDKGRAFLPVVVCMIDWGQRWFRAPEGKAVLLRHRACGRTFTPRLACGHCGDVLRARQIDIEPADGPESTAAPRS
jgi:DNA-binding HxlR family transcriptional regulator